MQVNCDKCDAWAHFKCAGFRPTVETSFYCIQCKNARKILSNSSSYYVRIIKILHYIAIILN